MFKANYIKHTLKFKEPSGTSRGVMVEKDTYFITLEEEENRRRTGIGECNVLKGLSNDDRVHYEDKLKEVCKDINAYVFNPHKELEAWPSISFGIETAVLDLEHKGKKILFPSSFTEGKAGIPINGLVWMADAAKMKQQLQDKFQAGFKCIKLKVGNNLFEDELKLLVEIRKLYPPDKLEIRLDANGAFKTAEALKKMELLSEFHIHSIEQPIRQGQWSAMAYLCKNSPVPIALDEELIGIHPYRDKSMLATYIKPSYLIFKPSLLGGFEATREWIQIADANNIGWWVTSALESNIGLNAISQWTYTLNNKQYQGLGTGQLYTNNILSPLVVKDAKLWYKTGDWDTSLLEPKNLN